MTFSIIVPTCGRRTLKRTLLSMRGQLTIDDEVLVVGDGPQPRAQAVVESLGWPPLRYIEGPQTGCFGNSQRMLGIAAATGDYLVFIDDDDTFTSDAINMMRLAVEEQPGKAFMWRFVDRNGGVLWRNAIVTMGNVGTPCICFPAERGRLGKWEEVYEGDFHYIRSTLNHFAPSEIVWRQEIVQVARRQA